MSSPYGETVVAKRNYGRKTENAGTVIVQMIEPWPGAMTRITGLRVSTAATAHILTMLRPLNMTTASAAVAAGGTSLVLSAQPGDFNALGTVATADNNIATNDYVVYQNADGSYVGEIVTVSSLTLTITAAATGGILAGAPVWFFGIVSDTNPANNQAHPRFNLGASTTTTFSRADGLTTIPDHRNMNVGRGCNQPLLLIIDNGTNASTIESTGVEYVIPSPIRGR